MAAKRHNTKEHKMNARIGLGHKLQLVKPHSNSTTRGNQSRMPQFKQPAALISQMLEPKLRKERQNVGKHLKGTCPSSGHLSQNGGQYFHHESSEAMLLFKHMTYSYSSPAVLENKSPSLS
jgi:hypothetical protein